MRGKAFGVMVGLLVFVVVWDHPAASELADGESGGKVRAVQGALGFC